MRIHATFLVFHDSSLYIATSSNERFFQQPETPFPSTIMPTYRNQNDASSGEEFSDISPTVDSDTNDDSEWTFPVVSSNTKRSEYEMACKFHCDSLLTRSDGVFRLLKVRKLRSANFKIKSKHFHSKIRNYVQISKGKQMLLVEVPAAFCQTMTSSSLSMPKNLES